MVESRGGPPIDIKLGSIVERDSKRATPKFATGDGRLESKREVLEDFATELRGFLETRDGRASATASAAHLKKSSSLSTSSCSRQQGSSRSRMSCGCFLSFSSWTTRGDTVWQCGKL